MFFESALCKSTEYVACMQLSVVLSRSAGVTSSQTVNGGDWSVCRQRGSKICQLVVKNG